MNDAIFQCHRWGLLTLTALINVPNQFVVSFVTFLAKLPCPADQPLRSVVARPNPVAEN